MTTPANGGPAKSSEDGEHYSPPVFHSPKHALPTDRLPPFDVGTMRPDSSTSSWDKAIPMADFVDGYVTGRLPVPD
jgi:hypothetical protein